MCWTAVYEREIAKKEEFDVNNRPSENSSSSPRSFTHTARACWSLLTLTHFLRVGFLNEASWQASSWLGKLALRSNDL